MSNPISIQLSLTTFSQEFSRSGGRCDLVVSESGEGLPHPNDAIGIPFFVLEFKSSGATDKEWETGINQMELTIAFIEKWRNFGQKIFGVVAAGQECQFFSRENGKTKPFPEGKLDLVDPNGHALQEMTKSLRFIDNDKPSKVCKNWPKVEQV